MSQLRFRGSVTAEGGDAALAGIVVTATMAALTESAVDEPLREGHTRRLQLGRAVTDSAGEFAFDTDENDPQIARSACVLRSCGDFKFQFVFADADGALLHETAPLDYVDDARQTIALRIPEVALDSATWEDFSRRMEASQTARLGDIAGELATLAPRGMFEDWTVARRMSVLSRLEQALLDPRKVLDQAGIEARFWRLADEAQVQRLRQQFLHQQRADLNDALDIAIDRARAVGSLRQLPTFLDPGAISRGDAIAGVNKFLGPGVAAISDRLPWLRSPLRGYRDYLRDRWVDNQRVQVATTAATIIARLNNRFHQDFTTNDTTDQSANLVLAPILLKMLQAPVGSGYGFGLAAAAIEAQGDRTGREYLDYLISKSGQTLDEVGKRYRLNLKRSDLEHSNPVQQNIDTLQRFFTDSYQSDDDPFAIKPDRVPGKDELLINVFPPEAAGPFFLEYEEWLEREKPFYPENHFDPRATYLWTLYERLQKTRDLVFANSMSVAEFLDRKQGLDHRATKWQWARNHIELYELIAAAHNDAKSPNLTAAEGKYQVALDWATRLRDRANDAPALWDYDPAAFAKVQRNTDVGTVAKLADFEGLYHRTLGQHWDSDISAIASDFLAGQTEISDQWWGKDEFPFNWPGNRRELRYLLDHLQFRLLPACLSEVQLAVGKYSDAVRQLIAPAAFDIFAAAPNADIFKNAAPAGTFKFLTDGSLPYATDSARTKVAPADPVTRVPANRAEIGFFKLALGNATLEWADALYRSNQPDSIMRARELYKGVLFLHGDDPEITPAWTRQPHLLPFVPGLADTRNPAIVSQVNRAKLGFFQIDANLNYYGSSSSHVPPVRFRVLKEAADRFAAGARGAQFDFLSYMQQLDQLTVSEMTARTMVAKANAAISIAQEQQKIAEFNVGEAQKQVDGINAQIAAKKAEIAKADEFFQQVKDFAGGMKDSVSKLGDVAFAGEGAAEPASAQNISTGDMLKVAMKVGTSSDMGAAAAGLGSGMAVAGPFAAFLYAGVTSISSMAAAIAKRAGELNALQTVALPAAKALVELKKRDVTIAQLYQAIAKADWQLGKDLLDYYASRLLNRAFLIALTEFSNRLMRRYLDLGGRTAWLAERALAFEQDRELGIVAFDYFPRNLRGVTGADLLQLHLAELDAARIQGLTQTVPVKHSFSLARDYPMQFGELKKTGLCRFATAEAPLQWVYPGVYGYRIRNVTVASTYADAVQPHRGLFSNQGVSLVTRDQPGSAHSLLRYPDALPLSEFRMRNDMWVFDLPDETLLPFEGSGIETVWELRLSKLGNASGFESMTDVLITFDMRASHSASLEAQHIAALPTTATRSLLVSATAMNPGVLATFRKKGGKANLGFDLATLARNANETQRKVLNIVLIAIDATDDPFTATFRSAKPAQGETVTFEKGVALSNGGVLSAGNGGVPLPLNTFVGSDVDQTYTLVVDTAANPGKDLTRLADMLLLIEYEADVSA